MTKVFNSGKFGYTCDTCHTLMYSGRPGSELWEYSVFPENVVILQLGLSGKFMETRQYCSIECFEGAYEIRNNLND